MVLKPGEIVVGANWLASVGHTSGEGTCDRNSSVPSPSLQQPTAKGPKCSCGSTDTVYVDDVEVDDVSYEKYRCDSCGIRFRIELPD